MLTSTDESVAQFAPPAPPSGSDATREATRKAGVFDARWTRLVKALRLEWLGQTIASLCWIVSVLAYGITATGDWLQLCAASAWFLANIAAAVTAQSD